MSLTRFCEEIKRRIVMGNIIRDREEIKDLYYLEDPEVYGDDVDFALLQGEKLLESTIKNSHKIQEKSYNLMRLSLAILAVLLGFLYFVLAEKDIFTLAEKNILEDFKFAVIALSLVNVTVIIIVLYYLLSALRVEKIAYLGRSPKRILNNKNMNLTLYQIKVLEIMDCSTLITKNIATVEGKAKNLKIAYALLTYYVSLLIIVATFGFIIAIIIG